MWVSMYMYLSSAPATRKPAVVAVVGGQVGSAAAEAERSGARVKTTLIAPPRDSNTHALRVEPVERASDRLRDRELRAASRAP